MNTLAAKILFLVIKFALDIEKIFGLSYLTRNSQRTLKFTILSWFIRLLCLISYPLCYNRLLNFSYYNDSITTQYARKLTFVFDFLLIACIYANETFNANKHQGWFEQLKVLLSKLIEQQTFKENFTLFIHCTLKLATTLSILLTISFRMLNANIKRYVPFHERCLIVFLLLPFIVMSLASNRIYVANTIVKRFLLRKAKELRSMTTDGAVKIKLCAINYRYMHMFFDDFNGSNGINLLIIISFCILNIVYKVNFI